MIAEPSHEPQPPGDADPLDQLLHEARWPEPTQAAQARITQSWEVAFSFRLRQERFSRRATGLAVAASLCAAALVGWALWPPDTPIVVRPDRVERVNEHDEKGHPSGSPALVERPRAVQKTNRLVSRSGHNATDSNRTAGAPAADAVPLIFSRPPSPLEEYLLAASGPRRKRGAKQKPPKPAPDPVVAAVQVAVKRLVDDPKVDARIVAESLRFAPAECDSRLLWVLNGSTPTDRIAALRLLTEFRGAEAVPLLLQATRDAALHPTAVMALTRISGPEMISELAQREPDKNLQSALFASLLTRGDAASLERCLEFIGNEKTSETALAACETVNNPPMELLFSALQSSLVPQRIAAARVIGRIDGPATTQRLIAIVERGTTRQEACIALLSSRGEEAVRYVADAERDPLWASVFQAARLYLPQEFQRRS